jgi:hypothetical protein
MTGAMKVRELILLLQTHADPEAEVLAGINNSLAPVFGITLSPGSVIIDDEPTIPVESIR